MNDFFTLLFILYTEAENSGEGSPVYIAQVPYLQQNPQSLSSIAYCEIIYIQSSIFTMEVLRVLSRDFP